MGPIQRILKQKFLTSTSRRNIEWQDKYIRQCVTSNTAFCTFAAPVQLAAQFRTPKMVSEFTCHQRQNLLCNATIKCLRSLFDCVLQMLGVYT